METKHRSGNVLIGLGSVVIVASLVGLGLFSKPTPNPIDPLPATEVPRISAESSVEEIATLMIESQTLYHILGVQMVVEYTSVYTDSSHDSSTRNIWLAFAPDDRLQIGFLNEARQPSYFYAYQDGQVLEEDLTRDVYYQDDTWYPIHIDNIGNRFTSEQISEGEWLDMVISYWWGKAWLVHPERIMVRGEKVIAGRPCVELYTALYRDDFLVEEYTYCVDTIYGIVLGYTASSYTPPDDQRIPNFVGRVSQTYITRLTINDDTVFRPFEPLSPTATEVPQGDFISYRFPVREGMLTPPVL